MREITLEELLEAGCHFGHQVTRSNPKARDFIFEARDNIHIIDLAKTKAGLEEAAAFIRDLAAKNGVLVIVGTKRQARTIVEEEVKRASAGENSGENLFYITNRWVGGLLTNFQEVSKNFKKYADFVTDLQDDEVKSRYTKKEVGGWEKEKNKLENLYGGVAKITKKPDCLFIIDSHLENLAVREALVTHVPTVALVDTNADPSIIDYPIPANDDAVGSIKLIVSYIIDAWIEGRKEGIRIREEEVKKTAVEAEKAKIKAEKEAARAAAASAKGSGEPKKKAEKEAKTKTKSKKS
ncbi:MAG: 30S ribosomal protein S2 [Candidatus Levybacteria bacterium RIFCSPLOWO2_01_FULL_39_24]|nr:MAG: 30S ribosomal protein S2 [Candidatus Levybacteria bacterium RIFCSPHIGHO2_01_FULL_40_16]OGH28223.1 MAG: 30S ribosomal protein S2 [Candidatus Levybacteria bacterium RIFCSPHIGHO2_12_FULL_39_9]OGH46658.1 MAG: 30S ribosomal protein S2 [Candidatus Levybacteria bacterium RIFCSPLOWO2_01_FULL_39_24]